MVSALNRCTRPALGGCRRCCEEGAVVVWPCCWLLCAGHGLGCGEAVLKVYTKKTLLLLG